MNFLLATALSPPNSILVIFLTSNYAFFLSFGKISAVPPLKKLSLFEGVRFD
jgi:hypothetical protein